MQIQKNYFFVPNRPLDRNWPHPPHPGQMAVDSNTDTELVVLIETC